MCTISLNLRRTRMRSHSQDLALSLCETFMLTLAILFFANTLGQLNNNLTFAYYEAQMPIW